MCKIHFALIVILFLVPNSVLKSQPAIEDLLNEVNQDSITHFVKELSGEVPVIINGEQYIISSRNANQPGNDIAADYIKQKLESYGLNTLIQSYSSTGANVIGEQTGTIYPNQKYIICAHFDDMPAGPIAPGADDNASGTAAVIEAARIFSNYEFHFTILYALWDEEEDGLVGSGYYADLAATQGDSILGVFNMDMIAWDSDNDNACEIWTKDVANSIEHSNKMVELNFQYNIGLIPETVNPAGSGSDHGSFLERGFSALNLIEDHSSDFNNFYHTTSDSFQYYNIPYYIKMAKLSYATLANYALNYDIQIVHTPAQSTSNTGDISLEASIISGLNLGTGNLAPRLYYRTSTGSPYSNFYDITGENINTYTYEFVMPGQTLGTVVEYYLAAQDERSEIVVTLPEGGSGFNPPGNVPPSDLFRFYVGAENILLTDNANNMNNWSTNGDWDTTSSEYFSTPSSFTDSPGNNYSPNANSYLRYFQSLDLTNSFGVVLTFNSRWEIETDWDYGQVQISTNNGNTWISLEGSYTNPGTGFFQPPGEPLYDGIQSDWVEETIFLSEYSGKQVDIRYILRTDSYNQWDGWYIDDIKITAYAIVPVNAPVMDKTLTYGLNQNYPNPFNPTTHIKYTLPEAGQVTLTVYNIIGEKVNILADEYKKAGGYEVEFNADGLPGGVYFYQIKSGSFVETRKMVLLK